METNQNLLNSIELRQATLKNLLNELIKCSWKNSEAKNNIRTKQIEPWHQPNVEQIKLVQAI